MSAAARYTLLLAVVFLLSSVRTSPHGGHATIHKRQAASGQDWNIPRNQTFQSIYNSEQYKVLQATSNDSTSHTGRWDQFGNNQPNAHAQAIRPDFRRADTPGAPLFNRDLWSNSSFQRTSPKPYLQLELLSATRSSEVKNSSRGYHNTSVNNNNSSPSKINKQSLATLARNPELSAVSRGNRRVAINNASLRTQTLSNSNDGFDNSDENKVPTSFLKVNISESDYILQGKRIQNTTRTIGSQSRNQPLLQLMESNVTLKDIISTGKNSHKGSGSESNTPILSAQGRIVTPTVTRLSQPEMSTGVREGLPAPTAGVSTSEFEGDSSASPEAAGGAIVFPDTKFKPRITGNKPPPCAQGSTFCTEAENYPLPHLRNVLKNEINFKEYFGEDKDDIRHRIGPIDGDPLCRSRENLIFPKMAQNKDDQWMFIVNLDKEYIQGIRVETCEKESSSCQLADAFPPGYTTVCRQKYVYRKLLALSEDGKPGPDSFKLPSCCACYYVKTQVGNRILSGNSSAISKLQG